MPDERGYDIRPQGWVKIAPQRFDWTVRQTWDERFPEIPAPANVEVPARRIRRGRPAQGPVTTYAIGIEDSPLVKIGYTSMTPEERCGALQTGLPYTLTVRWSTPGDFETQLHDMFADHRVRGEWFDLSSLGDAVQVIRSAVQSIRVQSAVR